VNFIIKFSQRQRASYEQVTFLQHSPHKLDTDVCLVMALRAARYATRRGRIARLGILAERQNEPNWDNRNDFNVIRGGGLNAHRRRNRRLCVG
jgi:hypothetical protein